MINPFDIANNFKKLQQQSQQLQQMLQQEEIVVEKNGVVVKMRGDQQIIEIVVDGVMENRIAEAINEAVKKTQQLAAQKLLQISTGQQ